MIRWFAILCLALLVGCSSTPKKEVTDTGINQQTEETVKAWKQLIDSGQNWSDMRRLKATNDFVNQFTFVDDIDHWQQEDYWATPLQTLVTRGGDCEDFSIAKYFTLTSMGMDEDKLRLTYVKALSLNQAHMVVSYYDNPKVTPLVLDNLNTQILPATQRDDLYPVYSFNGKGLWVNKKQQSDQFVDSSERISLWQKLLKSMDVEAANEPAMICLYQYYDLTDSEARTRCPD
ncbi:transglutaminase-like cysteine peptidase [Methylophaga thiooxydans]|uniref:transglutaminase-like cysteine peptidase n=1 Tax=Methylophaga thiooxydans TaxID=392484 RepID=UPI00030D5ECC|nr:transglutaminase-like cysteine peptidase [Methylophaga thiooxydans]